MKILRNFLINLFVGPLLFLPLGYLGQCQCQKQQNCSNLLHSFALNEKVIINEEQFEQRVLKYKQLAAEVGRREAEVKRVLAAGNEMLKGGAGGVCDVAELARALAGLNGQWARLGARVQAKGALYEESGAWVGELRRLLHEERGWLERLEGKVGGARAADAEQLSEQVDDIEAFVKAHSPQAKVIRLWLVMRGPIRSGFNQLHDCSGDCWIYHLRDLMEI